MRFVLLILILLPFYSFANEKNTKEILVIHSYHKTMSWVTNIDKAIEDIIQPKENEYIMHVEYMDTKRVFTPQYLEDLKKFYRLKYRNTKFDLILSSDDNAYNFLRENRDNLFGNTPTVFAGVNNYKSEDLKNLTNFTGVTESIDANNTIKTAIKLFPNTQNIFIINDYTVTGKAWRAKIEKQLTGLKKNIKYNENIPFKQLQDQLKNLASNTIVLLGVYFKDSNDTYFTYEAIGSLLSESSNSPVFCLLEFNLKNGVIGGSLISGYAQGEAMSKIANRVLKGEDPKFIPVKMTDTNKFIFDEKALLKYDIKTKDLPLNHLLTNKKIDFYEKHKVVILNSVIIIFILLFIITYLLISIKKRREIQKKLLSSEKEIKKINQSLEKTVIEKTEKLQTEDALKKLYLNTAEVLLVVLNRRGEIEMLNKTGCEILEVKEEEVLGNNWFEFGFLPQDRKDIQKRYFDKLVNELISEPKLHVEHELITRSGKERLFTWTSTLLKVNGKVIGTISSALDITEKKEQERVLLMQSRITAIEEMITNIAHHWRQPLASIAGELATMKLSVDLEEEITNEEMQTYINNIYLQCEFLSNTIDNFTKFLTADSTTVQKINLKNSFKKIEELIKDTFRDDNIHVIKNIEDCEIETNEVNFIDALLNIFNNAREAIIQKEVDINNRYVFVNLKKEENDIKITILDNAGGIDKKIIDKIFEPYYTTKHKSRGTGIGLYMTKQIINKHLKGSVEAEAIEYKFKEHTYKGAVFTVIIPFNI